MPDAEIEVFIRDDSGAVLLRTVLPRGEYVLGRNPDCALRVETDLVSRHHARLVVGGAGLQIEDLSSSNGTFVNGRRLTGSVHVAPGQSIQLGKATLEFHPVGSPSSGKYGVGKVVAQGGMGAILDVRDPAISRSVAMKVMLEGSTPEDAARFVQEAKITGQLEHPNIVPVHELATDEHGRPYYTMKFVRGITLRKVLELMAAGTAATTAKYPLGTLLTIFQKVCDAIAFAHAKGVIHRDLKPENVMLGDFGEVLVMDWGLAKVLGAAETLGPARATNRVEANTGSTMAGAIMGTPQYMSPEQARGEINALDERTDIYALGAMLYHLLALRPSVGGDDAWAIVDKVARGQIDTLTPAKGRPIPDSLAAVVRKAMAFDKTQRYARVADLQADVVAFQNGFATSAEKAGLGKQLVLAIKRHKAVSAAAGIILALTIAFVVKVIASEKRAQQSLARLKETAPTFASNARALVEKAVTEPAALDEALKNIDFALDLAPRERSYALTKAGILLAQQRLGEARVVFASILAREPGQQEATAGVILCDRLSAQRMPDGKYGTSTLSQLAAALREQGHTGEALFVMRNLDGAGREMIATWKAALLKAGIDRAPSLDGIELRLDLTGLPNLFDLAPLRGMPLNKLFLSNTGVSDLTPLAGMPLSYLNVGNTRVTDLTPLSGMPLRELLIDGQVKSLAPLRGAPLEKLMINANNRRIVTTGFGVLRGMPIRELRLGFSEFSDLRLLAGKNLTTLDISNSLVTDLTPLRDFTVENLQISNLSRANLRDVSFLTGQKALRVLSLGDHRSLTDLSALRGLALDELSVTGTAVADLRPLAGSTISTLALSNTPFCAVEQLEVMPNLKSVSLSQTPITDLTPLARSSIQRLVFDSCMSIRSIGPLAKMTDLRVLQLPILARDVEALRESKSLQWLGYRNDPPQLSDAGKRSGELREFWRMHDLEKQLRATEPNGRLRPSKFPLMTSRFPSARSLGGHWYAFIRGRFTWAEAKQFAEDLGGHLATISSAEEVDLARKACAVSASQVIWLGGLVDTPGGTWRWINGEPWKGTLWAKLKNGKSEPDGVDNKGQPETILALGHFGASMVSPPDICDVTADYKDVGGLLVEWED